MRIWTKKQIWTSDKGSAQLETIHAAKAGIVNKQKLNTIPSYSEKKKARKSRAQNKNSSKASRSLDPCPQDLGLSLVSSMISVLNLGKLMAGASSKGSSLEKEACSNGFQFPKTVRAPTRKKRLQVSSMAQPHLACHQPSLSSDLLQVSCHIIWVAVKNAAEKLHNLLIVQVVNTLNNTRQQQLHC